MFLLFLFLRFFCLDFVCSVRIRFFEFIILIYIYINLTNTKIYCYNISKFKYEDFELIGYEVKQVMNITDVGHMTDDALADGGGEDKMCVAASRLAEAKKSGNLPDSVSCFVFYITGELIITAPP